MEEPLFYTYSCNLLNFIIYVLASYSHQNNNLNTSLSISLTDVSLSNTCRAKASPNGVNGEHYWCKVINTLEYTTEVDSTYY